MTTPSAPDGSGEPAGGSTGGSPFLPPASPAAAVPTLPASGPPPVPESPFLPSATPPPAPSAPATAPAFDAKAMVDSQKHVNPNPAYGAMPKGTDEGREAARKLREQANRKRQRRRSMSRLVLLLAIAGAAVGGWFVYQALSDDVDDEQLRDGDDAAGGDGGALTPVGEQEQVIEALDDVNSGATPSAGGLLDAVEDAREVVGQAQPPVGEPGALLVADVFTPAVLDHIDQLESADGYERFVVRSSELADAVPSANDALLTLLTGFPQVPTDDAQLAVAPVVLPGDIAIAIQREDDRITRIVAVSADPPIAAVGP